MIINRQVNLLENMSVENLSIGCYNNSNELMALSALSQNAEPSEIDDILNGYILIVRALKDNFWRISLKFSF